MECPNCGRENRDVARFCQHCGAALLPAAPAAPEVAASEQAAVEERAVAEGGEVTEEDEIVTEQLTGAAQTAATGEDTVLEPAPEQAAAEGALPGPGEDEAAALPAAQVGEEAGPGAAAPLEGEGEALPPDAGWVELPVEDIERAGAAAADTDTGLEGMVGMASEEELIGGAEGAGTSAEVGGAAHGGALADEGEAVEGEGEALDEALDQAEAQELLVPFGMGQGEAAVQPEETLPAEAGLWEADLLPWRDESLSPDILEPGAVIDGRYRVVEVLAIDEGDVLYSARDLQRCPQCGFDENSPDQAFCTACGAVMEQKPLVSVLQRPADRDQSPDVEVLDHVVEQQRAYWVWQEPGKQTDVLGGSEEPMRMVIGQRSHPGRTRELDEDSLFTLTMSHTYESIEWASALFIVADGMGGHEAGELASRIAIRTLADVVLRDVFARELAGDALDEDAILETLERAMQAANEQVFLERERRENDMGTTVTAGLLREWTLYLAHVGDCRAYRWGEDGLQQLTTDHSVIASMVASGAAQPDEVYTHPHRSVIYRCVGDQPNVAVDTAVLSIEPGDRLVLCCDGLWEMLREDGIEEVLLREADPQRACDVMVEEANEAGGPDNISVIVVQL